MGRDKIIIDLVTGVAFGVKSPGRPVDMLAVLATAFVTLAVFAVIFSKCAT